MGCSPRFDRVTALHTVRSAPMSTKNSTPSSSPRPRNCSSRTLMAVWPVVLPAGRTLGLPTVTPLARPRLEYHSHARPVPPYVLPPGDSRHDGRQSAYI